MAIISEVTIANLALSHLGSAARIADLNEDSTEARHLRLHYEICRDSLLCEFDWSFATKTEALALLEEEPNDTWLYAYAKPSDCLRALRIVPTLTTQTPYPYRLMQHDGQAAVFTNVEEAYLEYIQAITDPTLFSKKFVETLALKLAVAVALPITQDKWIRDRVFDEYRRSLAQARTVDGNQGETQEVLLSEYERARE